MADDCYCGCCDGTHKFPPGRDNPVGSDSVAYRVRTHAGFKAALLASLSDAGEPALGSLHTRSDDDFTVAACDAAAMLLDVLTFYQERYANEFYLRTAAELRSLMDLARLIGYAPSAGVAASTRLAFLLEEAPGAPALAAEPVTIAAGTRVQSVPGPGEDPQTFETVEDITARVEWNAIPVQTTERQTFAIGTTELYVDDIVTPLQSGDVILIVGDERVTDDTSDVWDARVIDTIERDNDRGLTRVTFADGLGVENPPRAPAAANPRAYVFRQRTAVFGSNAPDPALLYYNVTDIASSGLPVDAATMEWEDFDIVDTIDLEGSYAKVVPDSWVLLSGGTGADSNLDALPGSMSLYLVDKVKHRPRTAFSLSGRVTAVTPDTTDHLLDFNRRETAAFAQSEELTLAERQLAYPLYDSVLALGRLETDLAAGQEVAISGRRPRLRVIAEASLQFQPESGSAIAAKPYDKFIVAAPPVQLVGSTEVAIAPADLTALLADDTATLRWTLIDRNDVTGTLEAPGTAVELKPSRKRDDVVKELCVIASTASDGERTTLQLEAPLANVYERATTTVCANVAPATHGETVSEIAGSGSAAQAGQRFLLKQSPLTYVSAATPQGRQSTLEVRVNDLLWDEVDSLFDQDATARVYSLRQDSAGRTIVQFGDGVEGQRLPSGRDNIRFTYRKALGSAGNLDEGRLTTLLGRPLGVKSVTNVGAASGGEDSETVDDLRLNAPLTMLTLGRAVSLQDYTDFARTFAGIAKAKATWTGSGSARGIFVTVAGIDGAAVDAASDTMQNLLEALRDHGDPFIPLAVQSYSAVSFAIEGTIEVASDADEDTVLADVQTALEEAYAFDARDFDQHVSIDEVMAVIQGVEGVDGVDLDALYRLDANAPASLNDRLFAYPAQLNADGTVTPAEILTLDTDAFSLGVMP